jgi:hypothetical protein
VFRIDKSCLIVASLLFWLVYQPGNSFVFGQVRNGNVNNRVAELANDDEEDDDDRGPENALWGQGAFRKMNRAQMRESLFGGLGGSENAFQKMKRESIRRDLDRIRKICSLTGPQMHKIDEAIEVDIQHMHAKIESILSDFEPKMSIEQFQIIQQNVMMYANSVNTEPVASKEFWRKVLRSQLTQDQLERIAKDKEQVDANKARTSRLHAMLLLQRKLGLTEKQRVLIEPWIAAQSINDLRPNVLLKTFAGATELNALTEKQRATLKASPKDNTVEPGELVPPPLEQILDDDPFK